MRVPVNLATARPGAGASRWAELDLIRGLAGALMVANHAGVDWVRDSEPMSLNGALTFTGSLAPVFFFMVTGLGRGIQSARVSTHRPFSDTLKKVLVLLLADAALWLSPSVHLGLNFLGFIGISTLALELVSMTRRPFAVAAAAAALCLVLRFAVAPRLHFPDEPSASVRFLSFVLGRAQSGEFAYPLCPWLAYPFLGFMLGRRAAQHADAVRAARPRFAFGFALAGAAGLAICVWFAARGMVFFRWGSMSFAYCWFGFAAVFVGLSLALLAVWRLPASWVVALSLPGIASFALVPFHYVVIWLGRAPLSGVIEMAFPVVVPLLVALVFSASKAFNRLVDRLASVRQREAWLWGVLVAAVGLLLLLSTVSDHDLRTPIMASVQLLSCALFALTSRQTVAVRSVGVPSRATE
jgi:hypothetical protein